MVYRTAALRDCPLHLRFCICIDTGKDRRAEGLLVRRVLCLRPVRLPPRPYYGLGRKEEAAIEEWEQRRNGQGGAISYTTFRRYIAGWR